LNSPKTSDDSPQDLRARLARLERSLRWQRTALVVLVGVIFLGASKPGPVADENAVVTLGTGDDYGGPVGMGANYNGGAVVVVRDGVIYPLPPRSLVRN